MRLSSLTAIMGDILHQTLCFWAVEKAQTEVVLIVLGESGFLLTLHSELETHTKPVDGLHAKPEQSHKSTYTDAVDVHSNGQKGGLCCLTDPHW